MFGRNQNKIAKTVLLRLSSADLPSSLENLSESKITATLQKTLTNVISIRPVSWRIPWSWFNVDTTNNVIFFNTGASYISTVSQKVALSGVGSYKTATIVPGNYSGVELSSVIQTALNAAASGSGFVVSYNTSGQVFTVTASVGFVFYIISQTGASNSMGLTLGMTTGYDCYSMSASGAYSIVFPNGSFLLKAQEVLVHCDAVRSFSCRQGAGEDHVLCAVSLAGFGYGDLIYNFVDYNAVSVSSSDMSDVELWITNEKFEHLNLHGYNFSITLEITYLSL